jgi:hypothetical protein
MKTGAPSVDAAWMRTVPNSADAASRRQQACLQSAQLPLTALGP